MSNKLEKILWNFRYITILAVLLSIISAFSLIVLGSWDIIQAVIFYNPLFDDSISNNKYTPRNPRKIISTWKNESWVPFRYSIISKKIGYEKIRPIPIAIEFSSIDSNIVTQWIAKSGPKINPGFNKDLKLNPFLAIKRLRNILPKKVLIPTRDIEEISEVLIINGIVPQEIANKIIPE